MTSSLLGTFLVDLATRRVDAARDAGLEGVMGTSYTVWQPLRIASVNTKDCRIEKE